MHYDIWNNYIYLIIILEVFDNISIKGSKVIFRKIYVLKIQLGGVTIMIGFICQWKEYVYVRGDPQDTII